MPGSNEPVRFGIGLRQPTSTEHDALRRHIFAKPWHGMQSAFWSRLSSSDQWFLTVHDRGTTGLSGPERADQAGSSSNFSDFVWNFGAPKAQEGSGGTYGCGRTVFFTVGRANDREDDSVALVHTRYRDGTRIRSRFIAMGLTASHDRMYTGRHWWGRQPASDVPIAPVEDPSADRLAEMLGLPGFGPRETGTTILVPCCDVTTGDGDQLRFGEQAAREVMETIADAALWHCWPKLVDLGHGPEMRFSLSLSGAKVGVRDPEEHPEIRHFVHCLRGCLDESQSGVTIKHIASQRPKRHLGVLAMKRFVAQPTPNPESPTRPFGGDVHHTALMRAPKLVVKYLTGPENASEATRWAGVFVANDEVDNEFADAEPPPHDDWIPEPGAKFERNLVRIALRRIDEKARAFSTVDYGLTNQPTEPLGRLADALGDLLVGGPDGGPGRTPRRGGGGVRRERAKISEEESSLEHEDGPDVWQAAFLTRLGAAVKARAFDGRTPVAPIRMAVSKGHGVGGSTLAAWLTLWIMATRRHAHGTITANTRDLAASVSGGPRDHETTSSWIPQAQKCS